MKKNLQIQSIRGISCLLIIIYHLMFRYNQLFANNSILSKTSWNILAGFGVITFFVISGYYLAKPHDGNIKEISLIYLKRFLNLYIPYLCSILIIFFVDKIGYSGTNPSWLDLLKNIFLLQYFTGNYVDGAHWYIIILIFFMIVTYIANLIRNVTKKEQVYICLLIIYSFLSLIAVILTKYNIVQNAIIMKIMKILFYTQFPKIILGFSLFYILNNKYIYFIPLILNYCILIFISVSHSYIVPIVLIILTLVFLKKMFFLEKSKLLIFIGNCSYSIYLIHQNIAFTIENILTQYINYYWAFVIAIVFALIFGIVFYFLIEKNIKKVLCKISINS